MEQLLQGFLLVLQGDALLAIAVGTISGTIVGAMPGLSSTLGVALLIPFTFGLPPAVAFGLLSGMYCSSIYGGSITAILINTPGTGAAAATTLDGYPMTRKGMAGKALATAIWSSFFGGIFGTLALLLIAPPLSMIALKFGPPESFMVTLFGMTIIASVSGGSMAKGIIAAMFGLLISTVGLDPQIGYGRFTFGRMELYGGIGLVLALVGFFSIPEALTMVRDKSGTDYTSIKIKSVSLTLKEASALFGTWLHCSIIGTLIGIIPGVGTPVACFLAYNERKRFSKNGDLFGTGVIEGVAAPESANNAVEGGSMIPLLTLGIPGSAQTAVYLGAMMIQGLRPGPSLFTEQAAVTYSIIWGLMIANVFMLVVGLGGMRVFLKILSVKKTIMIPLIITFATIGSYALNFRVFDIGLMFGLGIAGYFMRKNGIPIAPAVIAIILGPIGEDAFLQSMSIFHGNLFLFFTRPICVFFIAATALSVFYTVRRQRKALTV
ncbi:tripartite tricarboxylate transporter permease [Desulfovibrio sp. OttesenSCG-928-O18]|nr:tripartite tricarboxylate transporter permease [Desulfovibrio sp. OttesenSCG-928-O18]